MIDTTDWPVFHPDPIRNREMVESVRASQAAFARNRSLVTRLAAEAVANVLLRTEVERGGSYPAH